MTDPIKYKENPTQVKIFVFLLFYIEVIATKTGPEQINTHIACIIQTNKKGNNFFFISFNLLSCPEASTLKNKNPDSLADHKRTVNASDSW